ncbi:MAG: polymer-forming cytoskeletal family protein [Spirochaetaceae bacterium]|nr:MAG: polymer-forming cytoskeletal family protein [Spirochaetaceae bacterium]
MSKITEHQHSEEIATTLGKSTHFDGVMRFKDSLKILGSFHGEIISSGRLVIADGADIKANIKVGSIVVGGIIHGNIIAKEKLEMLASGKVFGNIKTAKLVIADGVLFEGKCEMIKDPDSIDIFADNVAEIKKNVEAVEHMGVL